MSKEYSSNELQILMDSLSISDEGAVQSANSVMRQQDIFDYTQPKTGADLGALVLLLDAVVAIPDVVELLLRDTLAVVDDVDPHLFISDSLAHDDGLVIADVVDRVVDEVVHHLSHPQLVAHDEDLAVVLKDDVQPVVLDELRVT